MQIVHYLRYNLHFRKSPNIAERDVCAVLAIDFKNFDSGVYITISSLKPYILYRTSNADNLLQEEPPVRQH